MLVSIAVTTGALIGGGSSELFEMVQYLGITLACVGLTLFATKRYWRNARRMA
jgi:hypothetical protein